MTKKKIGYPSPNFAKKLNAMHSSPLRVGKRIGMFGGAFDPPHKGHAEVIRLMLAGNYVDELWVIPARQRLEKQMIASYADRLLMMQKLVEEEFPHETNIFVRDDQTKDTDFSFTIDLLDAWRKQYPSHDFWIVIGSDLLSDIPYWKNGDRLLNEVKFIVVERYKEQNEKLQYPKNYVIMSRSENWKCSSTLLRKFLKDGRDISLYVAPGVLAYIQERRIYQ